MGPSGSGREFAFYSLSRKKSGEGSEQVSDGTKTKARQMPCTCATWNEHPLNFVL